MAFAMALKVMTPKVCLEKYEGHTCQPKDLAVCVYDLAACVYDLAYIYKILPTIYQLLYATDSIELANDKSIILQKQKKVSRSLRFIICISNFEREKSKL